MFGLHSPVVSQCIVLFLGTSMVINWYSCTLKFIQQYNNDYVDEYEPWKVVLSEGAIVMWFTYDIVKCKITLKLFFRCGTIFPIENTFYWKLIYTYNKTWSSPRLHLFPHGISFGWTTKLHSNFLNQFLFYFHI